MKRLLALILCLALGFVVVHGMLPDRQVSVTSSSAIAAGPTTPPSGGDEDIWANTVDGGSGQYHYGSAR